jgi:Skp family chaperone for outer membrane proteins
MAAFDNLKRFFSPDDRTRAFPDDAFIVIDRDRTAAQLQLDERAKERGERNFPPADTSVLDDVEAQIVTEIGEYADRARINAAASHRVYHERLSELALLRELSSVTGSSVEAQGDFKTTIIQRQGRLALARDAIRESYGELSEFKKLHRLNRPAQEGMGPIYAASAAGVSWLVESAINTPLLHVNDDMGYVGGFLHAAVIAALNVGPAALVGRLVLPYLFHRSIARKLLAASATSIWLAFLTTWNLLAGHFRDAKANGLPAPETESLRLLAETPFLLDSVYSYGLLVAGFAFALLAAVATYKMKDPYPGYGDIYRRHQDRCDEYADEIDEALEELKQTRNEAIDNAQQTRDELRRQFSERGQIIAARDSHRHRFLQHQDSLEAVANQLLAHYRSANVRARTDDQIPAHFKTHWRLARTDLPATEDESLDAEVVRAQAAIGDSITAIAEAYEAAISSFQHLDQIKESLNNG